MALLSKGTNTCCSTDGMAEVAEYAKLSREWAISEEPVQDGDTTDDSSKTWALRAKEWSELGYDVNLDGDFNWTGTHTFSKPILVTGGFSHPSHLVTKEYADAFLQGGVDLNKDYNWTGQHNFDKPPQSTDVPSLPTSLVNRLYVENAIAAAETGGFDPNASYNWGGLQIFSQNVSCLQLPTEEEHLVNRQHLNTEFGNKQQKIVYGTAGYYAKANSGGDGFDWEQQGDSGEPLDYAANYNWTGQHSFTQPPKSSQYPADDDDLVTKAYANTLLGGGGTPVNGMPSYSSVDALKTESNSVLQGLLGKNVATAGYYSGGAGGGIYTIVAAPGRARDGYVNFYVGSGSSYVAQLNYVDKVSMHQMGCRTSSDCSGILDQVLGYNHPIHVPAGVWRLDNRVRTWSTNVTITGEGPKSSVFDVSNRDGDNTGHFEFNGQLTRIGTSSARSYMGDSHIKLSIDRTLKPGDDIIINDNANYSFSPFRKYYRNGEYNTIHEYQGNGVYTLKKSNYSGYRSGVRIYLLRGASVNVSDIGFAIPSGGDGKNQGSATFLASFYNQYITDSVFKRVHANSGNWKTAFSCRHSTRVRMEDCEMTVHQTREGIYNDLYGANFGGCEDVVVDGGTFWSDKHSLLFTAAGGSGMVATRNCTAKNCNIHARRGAMDMHGSTEHVIVKDCRITGGTTMGTGWTIYDGNTFITSGTYGSTTGGTPTLSVLETQTALTFSYKIINNIFFLRGSDYKGSLLRIRCSDYEDSYGIDCKGALIFRNNHVYWESGSSNLMLFASSRDNENNGRWLDFSNASVHIHGNSFDTLGQRVYISMDKGRYGTNMKLLSLVNNRLDGVRLNTADINTTVVKDNY